MAVLTLNNDEFRALPRILQVYAQYLSAISGNSAKTVCEYLMDLRTFFRFLVMRSLGKDYSAEELAAVDISGVDLPQLRMVTSETIIEFLMYVRSERDNSTTTRMRKLSSLKSFFHYLYTKKRLIDVNPVADIEGPKPKKTLPKYLSLEEAVALLEAVRADTESKSRIRDFCMISLFLNTGMRLAELVGLNLDSFDPDLTKVKVLGKGNKERMVYINEAARSALQDYLRERLDPRYIRTGSKAFFLSRREERISPKTVQWVVYKYLHRAGLGNRGLSVHKLRHTAATLMYQSGQVDIRVLKEILGHEQLNTTQIYTHVVDQNMEAAMQQNPLAGMKIQEPRSDITGTDDEE